MDKKLYDLMNWPDIEGVVYSECDNPRDLMGGHLTKLGYVIQTFYPGAEKMWVKVEGKAKEYPMEMVDDAGYFVALIPGKKAVKYTLLVANERGKKTEFADPYSFPSMIDEKALKAFNAGICYDVYNWMGSHPMTIDGVKGTNFAVWAPNALRVSVVGDFNNWDGRLHQMHRLGESGVFELFVPGVVEGDIYKYEIKCKNSMVMLKADPYGNSMEVRPGTASVVCDLNGFKWSDTGWIKNFSEENHDRQPMSVYELHLGSFKKKGEEFLNYRELAREVIDYVKEMGYTHVELMPILEHPLDASWGYQVLGYYAPTSRYGSPKDFMFFVNALHQAGIGVILDWVPAHFPKDQPGLAGFDGTCLYEHQDPRQGEHPDWGTLIFNYGRPEVSNFLIANALYWAKLYHIDGIRTDAVASMLYLDYGKQPGQWIPNIYGGKENLESIELLKHMNSIFKKSKLHTMLIAEESTAWPMVTGDVNEGSLGFDYKWNMGWMNDFLSFMKWDPIYRKAHYGELTFSMLYNYSEKFVLVLSHDEVVHGKGSMITKMPGDSHALKFANLRAAYGYMFTHPGKKLLFMGQDFAQFDEWNENEELQWSLLQYDEHAQMKEYVVALNKLYKSEKALYELDYETEGFEWINCSSADETILVFMRKASDGSTLVVTVNFTPVVRNKYKIGVPFAGKYKEIFNSDDVKFGGEGNTNPRVKPSDESECDGRENSIRFTVPPLGISVMRYIPYTDEELKAIEEAKKAKLEKERKAAAAKAKAKELAETKKAKAKETAKASKTAAASKSKTTKTSKTTSDKTSTGTKSKVAVKSKLKILNND